LHMVRKLEHIRPRDRTRLLSEWQRRGKIVYYVHKQTSSWFGLILDLSVLEIVIIAVILAGIIYRQQLNVFIRDIALSAVAIPVLVGLPVLLWIGLWMSSLTVRIHNDRMTVHFGGGLFHKTFLLRDIATCRTVENSWLYQKGIRWIFNGWVYTMSGQDAVELTFKNGKKARIGSDQPGKLCNVIQQALSRIDIS
jgi:hypothetical protein